MCIPDEVKMEKKIIKAAFYGKGGIGKSTTVSNIAAALAQSGLKVMQIGCDPKADSTVMLRHGREQKTIMELVRSKRSFAIEDMVQTGFAGVICAEAGGPLPGLGCAGRGIITALEEMEKMGVYDTFSPDIVLYDVLGDVVCGGFAMPMRKGYADRVFILTSGENMSMHAAANISMALDNFKERGYAGKGGLILNRRDVKNEEEKVRELSEDLNMEITGDLSRCDLVPRSEEMGMTVLEAFPESECAEGYRKLAREVLRVCT